MEISFQNNKLEKIASDERKCLKEFGKKRADLFLQRLSDLNAALTLEDVRYLPGHFHELTGDRKGQWACDLDQPYRLILNRMKTLYPQMTMVNIFGLRSKESKLQK